MVLQTNRADYYGTKYTAAKDTNQQLVGTEDYLQLLRDKIGEMYDKVENNETEESFQIGANSFTQAQWDRLLLEFDDIQDTIKELMREEHAKRQAQSLEQDRLEKKRLAEDVSMDAIVSESITCEYTSSDSESKSVLYVVWYNETGIYCKKMDNKIGEKKYEWVITFDSSEQYQQVKQFMERFDSDDNLRFAPNQNFWQDFFAGMFNVEEFITFFEGTNNGVPNYLIEKAGSMFVDKEKAKWAPYMNEPELFTMYTAEEMVARQAELRKYNLSNEVGGRQVTLDRNALFSICHVPTGESANVYKSAEYSESNPVYKVKGIDAGGNEYEQDINANDINPNSCSYIEMLVWSVHNGKNSPSDYLTLARLRSEAGDNSYHTEIDYLAIVQKLLEEIKVVGKLEDIIHYEKWLKELSQT